MSADNTTVKDSTFNAILPTLTPPKIRRQHLRKYSWLPDVLRLKGSIIYRIIGPVLTITLFASGIAYAQDKGLKMVQTNSIVPLLSVVVGLLLVFRNGTSYDRFWEGRKTFATLSSNIRNLSRQIWVSASLPVTVNEQQTSNDNRKAPICNLTAVQLHDRKVEALQLCLSFVFAAKHYLRGEDGIYWDDLRALLPSAFIQKKGSRFSTEAFLEPQSYLSASAKSPEPGSGAPSLGGPRVNATKRVQRKRSKHHVMSPSTPLLSACHSPVDFRENTDQASMPLPLIIAHELTRVIFSFRKDGCLETVGPAGTNAMFQLVNTMVDQLTSMERIANTPIPTSYGIHLKQCVTLYLFALPLSLVNDLGWVMVPIVTIVAFTFMGIEGIAEEIEMPFGNDGHDLPLDRFCLDLKEEIFYIIENLPDGGRGLQAYDDGEGDD